MLIANEGRETRWSKTTDIRAEDHFGLVAEIVKGFVPRRFWVALEDTEEFGDGLVGLQRALLKFNPDLGWKFSTLAGTCIRNEIIQGFKRRKKHIGVKPLSVLGHKYERRAFELEDRRVPVVPVDTQTKVKAVLALLPEETDNQRVDKYIFIRYYLDNRTLKEIGIEMVYPFLIGKSLTKERVRQRKAKVEQFLRDLLQEERQVA